MQMMSLHVFDRTFPVKFPFNTRLSPLLTGEALRRVAWSTFYADTMLEAGRYGFHVVDEKSYRVQLPCDQTSFLRNQAIVTQPLCHNPNVSAHINADDFQRAPLDMSGYLLRTAAVRRRALHFAFRASHREQTVEEMMSELAIIEAEIEEFVRALPKSFQFNTDNIYIHHDQLITFILLHVLRHNLFIIIGRAALHIYQRDPTKVYLLAQVRRKRISHALPIAAVISEGLKAGIPFDTHIGVHAYVALESTNLPNVLQNVLT